MLRGGGRGPGGALSADGDLPDEPGCGEPARGGGGGGAFAAGVGPGPGGAVSREAAAGGGIPFVENGGWGEGAVPLGSAVAGRRTRAVARGDPRLGPCREYGLDVYVAERVLGGSGFGGVTGGARRGGTKGPRPPGRAFGRERRNQRSVHRSVISCRECSFCMGGASCTQLPGIR